MSLIYFEYVTPRLRVKPRYVIFAWACFLAAAITIITKSICFGYSYDILCVRVCIRIERYVRRSPRDLGDKKAFRLAVIDII